MPEVFGLLKTLYYTTVCLPFHSPFRMAARQNNTKHRGIQLHVCPGSPDSIFCAQVLERCMMEALRLFPPLIMLLRQAKAPFAVTTSQGKTYVISKVSSLAFATLSF